MNKKNKILIIDCQVFQTPSWHRGMGKYSKEFLRTLLFDKNTKDDINLFFLFNSNLESNQEIVDLIKANYNNSNFIYIDLLIPKEPRTEYSVGPIIIANKEKIKLYCTRNKIINFDFLILALYIDEVCSVFPEDTTEKLLIYYDSIPYLYHERYDQFKGFFTNFYLPHTATVYEATKILTISKTVANDLHNMFGIPEDVIFNIDGASIPRKSNSIARPKHIKAESTKFILLPTGQELRKNNTRVIKAFDKYKKSSDNEIKLIITSHFSDEMKKELTRISSDIVFSGNVSEGEMLWLYQNCRFVLFPSEYEGLGLPILEAVEQNKPIACSDISVFREMSKDAFTYFNPLNIESIVESIKYLEASINDSHYINKHYRAIKDKYTWKNTINLFNVAHNNPKYEALIKKKKIAIFCPDSSGFSAIGKVITESHAWYSRYFEITYYFDKGPKHESIRPTLLHFLSPNFDIEQFTIDDVQKYDALIYHIGNSEYHLNIIHIALAFKGYVILHDTFLNGAFKNMIELGFINQKRYDLENLLDENIRNKNTSKYPKSDKLTSIINNQYGVIVHSNYAKDVVASSLLNSNIEVKMANLPVDIPMFSELTRKNDDDKINISFAGIIAKVKGIDIVEKIANSEEFNDCSINIFGYSSIEPERFRKLLNLPLVKITTNPSDYEFQSLLARTDILVNVRQEYKGETSLTTLEAMRYGVTVIVRDFGWYSELPEDIVVKVKDSSTVLSEIRFMLNHSVEIEQKKNKIINYIRKFHTHQLYAKAAFDIIKVKDIKT